MVTNVELDHHATYATLAELELAFQEFAAPAELRVLGPGVELPGRGREVHFGIGEGGLRAEEVELHPGGSRFRVDGVRARAARARAPQRAERARGARGLPRGRARGRRRRAGLGRLHGGGAPFRGARPHRRGRARGRRLRAPSDGGPRHARGRPDARAAPARGLLPAPPLLAHAHARPRVRGRPRAGRPRGSAGRLSRARAGGGLPRRERPDRRARGGRAPRRAGACGGCRGWTTPSACCAPSCARATCCSRWGRETWTPWRRGSPRDPGRRPDATSRLPASRPSGPAGRRTTTRAPTRRRRSGRCWRGRTPTGSR